MTTCSHGHIFRGKFFLKVQGGRVGSKKWSRIDFLFFFWQNTKKKIEKNFFFFGPKIFLRPHVGLKGFQLAIKDFLVEKIAFKC